MSVEFVMGSSGVPVGSYRAEFVGAEDLPRKTSTSTSLAFCLRWKVTDGPEAGNETGRITSAKMNREERPLGKFSVALKGSDQSPVDENFAFGNYVGVTGNVLVEGTDNGGTRVSVFLRDAQPSPQATAQPPNGQAQPATQQAVEQF